MGDAWAKNDQVAYMRLVPGLEKCDQSPQEREIGRTYPRIDNTFHDSGICLGGKVYVLEIGFHGENNLLKPFQELELLACSEIGKLRGMLLLRS